MNIYVEIMTIYGITFMVSMFVALIIWGLAKLIDALPDGSFSLMSFVKKIRQNVITGKEEKKEFLKELRDTQVERSSDLNSYRHEHA